MISYQNLLQSQQAAQTEAELKKNCDQFCEAFGFEYYIFAICSVTSLSAPEISTITNYPDEWIKIYFEEKYQRFDPVVRYCFEYISPIRWDHLREMSDFVTPEGEMVLDGAAKIGLAHGLSIPLKAHTGEICIFSLATSNSDNIHSRLNEMLPVAQAFAPELFNSLTRINHHLTEKKESLTAREIECLFWACEGKTTWEISKIIDVTERTVVFHLTSATKKLGATNRQHAVAKAITSGLIKPKL